MVHALIAVLFQSGVGLLWGRWLSGGLIASAFFAGREITQAEYRWIEHLGQGKRANMPIFGGFDPVVWTMKSLLDVALPIAATLVVCLIVWAVRGALASRASAD